METPTVLNAAQDLALLPTAGAAAAAMRLLDQQAGRGKMVAIFAFLAGLYYDLPLGYFLLGVIFLLLD